jgi:hypothetical protein
MVRLQPCDRPSSQIYRSLLYVIPPICVCLFGCSLEVCGSSFSYIFKRSASAVVLETNMGSVGVLNYGGVAACGEPWRSIGSCYDTTRRFFVR